MKSDSAKDEEVMRRIDSLMQDPNKWEDYIASRVERVLKNWPRPRGRAGETLQDTSGA
jgi:hypothetical protein